MKRPASRRSPEPIPAPPAAGPPRPGRSRTGLLVAGLLLLLALYANFPYAPGGPLAPPTPAPTATPAPAPDRAAAEAIDPRRLAADPAAVTGRHVRLVGRALNVEQPGGGPDPYTWINLQAEVRDRALTERVIVRLRPPDRSILRDDCYAVYGIVAGASSARRLLTGASEMIVTVDAYAIEPLPTPASGPCLRP
jgi:hypothetical protein